MKITGVYSHHFESTKEQPDKAEIYLVSFTAKAEICTFLNVSVTLDNGDVTDMDYFVPVQKTTFSMLINASVPKSITFDSQGEIDLCDIILEKHPDGNLNAAVLKTGMFLQEPFKKVSLTENDDSTLASGCNDFVLYQNMLFTIGSNKLCAIDITDREHPKLISYVHIDAPLRQIDITKDGLYILITCRQNGLYIFDVKNPSDMLLCAKYDTIEFATGLVIEQNYAFVSCRQFGVEVIDITNPKKPRHVSIVRCGEAQSCKIHNGILYAGVWGGCRVDIIDVSNPANPVYLSKAPLNGKGDGLCVHSFGNKTYLYAATGQHSVNLPINSPVTEPRLGQGNGLDIFDVTNPESPVHLSTSKIDGRFYNYANDYWETEISVTPDGRVMCYLVNSHNGVYIFDVTDPRRVKRLGSVNIIIPKNSPKYRKYSHPSRAVVFPYDQDEFLQDVAGAVICLDGYMYIAGIFTGLHIYKDNEFIFESLTPSSSLFSEQGSFYGEKIPDGSIYYSNTGQIYGVCAWNDFLFVSSGQKGLCCLDAHFLKERYRVDTHGVCFDCTAYGNKLYSAEGEAGLIIYDITDNGLTKSRIYKSKAGLIKSVKLSPCAKYAVLQCGSNVCEVIKLKDFSIAHSVKTTGIMYHKNLCSCLVDSRYMGVYGNSSQTYWFDFGKDDNLPSPVILSNGKESLTFSQSEISMEGGYGAFGKYALGTVHGKKYVLYQPQNPVIAVDKMNCLEKKSANLPISGKPVICQNKAVFTNRIDGSIYLCTIGKDGDLTVDKSINVAGNPDIALIHKGKIYVPLGYQGLLML